MIFFSKKIANRKFYFVTHCTKKNLTTMNTRVTLWNYCTRCVVVGETSTLDIWLKAEIQNLSFLKIRNFRKKYKNSDVSPQIYTSMFNGIFDGNKCDVCIWRGQFNGLLVIFCPKKAENLCIFVLIMLNNRFSLPTNSRPFFVVISFTYLNLK